MDEQTVTNILTPDREELDVTVQGRKGTCEQEFRGLTLLLTQARQKLERRFPTGGNLILIKSGNRSDVRGIQVRLVVLAWSDDGEWAWWGWGVDVRLLVYCGLRDGTLIRPGIGWWDQLFIVPRCWLPTRPGI